GAGAAGPGDAPAGRVRVPRRAPWPGGRAVAAGDRAHQQGPQPGRAERAVRTGRDDHRQGPVHQRPAGGRGAPCPRRSSAEGSRAGARGDEGMKILLVEDNELNRDMLSRRLVRRGHRVLTAADGAAAVQLTAAEQPDLVLMDLGLPVLDGWAATRQLKADPRTATIPVIALTAHAMAEDRDQALAAGCDEFDTKPVDLERLTGKIAAVTGNG